MLSTTAGGVTGRPPAIIDTPGCSHLDQPSKTFLQALNGQHCAAAIIPEEVQVEKYKGLPCVAFTIDEVNQLSARFSRALVGTFYYGRPSLQFIRLCLERIGFMAFTVALIDTNHILINFSSDNDYHRCFKRHDGKIGSYSMRISKWTPDFDPRYESPILPLWIAIKDLPIHLHSRSSLLRIGNVFGKAIKIDTTTENFGRPSTARVCVEVDISKHLSTKFYVKNGETPVLLTAVFEDLPEYYEQEVKDAIWSLSADSSAGPDGFNGEFYKQNWEEIKEDCTKAVQEFFLGIPIPKCISHSNIILIPKKENPITYMEEIEFNLSLD
ncbi:unnamed protein product [Cuscuta campestris]|uniref:DUF4283 domain-containing protein n=1 Tax=Cuscuta campestris TaxID=132261 RepID=A0A484M4Z7_9ASTE|nr:unnamed protein product [Cuscuta campestris]